MRRRDFITVLGGATAWPLAALAQQSERKRRIGVIFGAFAQESVEGKARKNALLEGLRALGWTDGSNVQIDIRWPVGNSEKIRDDAVGLVALEPDVIVASGSAVIGPLMQATHTIPIVFAIVVDPVGEGYVHSMARPGGNVTGFVLFEYSLSGKWVELLKEIAPSVTRVGVLRDAALTAGAGQFAVIQAVAPSLGVDVTPVNGRDAQEIERELADFARAPNGGLIVTAGASTVSNQALIISLAARYKLPTVYLERSWAVAGGLISYGPNVIDQFHSTARYVDRILKGEKPADLPVQAPDKYQLVVNRKTANSLGLTMLASILIRADEVIE